MSAALQQRSSADNPMLSGRCGRISSVHRQESKGCANAANGLPESRILLYHKQLQKPQTDVTRIHRMPFWQVFKDCEPRTAIGQIGRTGHERNDQTTRTNLPRERISGEAVRPMPAESLLADVSPSRREQNHRSVRSRNGLLRRFGHGTLLNRERVSRTVRRRSELAPASVSEKAVHDPHWSRDQAAAQQEHRD